jgi:Zn-dependent protease
MIWVALAGPGSNVVMAVAWTALFYLMRAMGVEELFFLKMAQAGITVNLVLFALNMFPLPPLDGGRILVGLLPTPQAMAVSRIEPFGFFIVLGLVFTGLLGTYWLRPLMSMTGTAIEILLTPLRWVLF